MRHVYCKFFDPQTGRCNHEHGRVLLGMMRMKCPYQPTHESSCRMRIRPDIDEGSVHSEQMCHGPCIDLQGFEWEVARVTEEQVFLRIRSPYDSTAILVALDRAPLVSRLTHDPAKGPL